MRERSASATAAAAAAAAVFTAHRPSVCVCVAAGQRARGLLSADELLLMLSIYPPSSLRAHLEFAHGGSSRVRALRRVRGCGQHLMEEQGDVLLGRIELLRQHLLVRLCQCSPVCVCVCVSARARVPFTVARFNYVEEAMYSPLTHTNTKASHMAGLPHPPCPPALSSPAAAFCPPSPPAAFSLTRAPVPHLSSRRACCLISSRCSSRQRNPHPPIHTNTHRACKSGGRCNETHASGLLQPFGTRTGNASLVRSRARYVFIAPWHTHQLLHRFIGAGKLALERLDLLCALVEPVLQHVALALIRLGLQHSYPRARQA